MDKRGCFVELPPTEIERKLMQLDSEQAFASGQSTPITWQLRQAYLRHLNIEEDELEEN